MLISELRISNLRCCILELGFGSGASEWAGRISLMFAERRGDFFCGRLNGITFPYSSGRWKLLDPRRQQSGLLHGQVLTLGVFPKRYSLARGKCRVGRKTGILPRFRGHECP